MNEPAKPQGRDPVVPPGTGARPAHQEVVDDLKAVRERGITRVRSLSLPALETIARQLYPENEPARGIETVLRNGLAQLDEGMTKDLAAISFGLETKLRGTPPPDLRKAAARHRGVLPETFRKTIEPLVLDDLAGGILAFLVEAERSGVPDGPRVPPADSGQSPGKTEGDDMLVEHVMSGRRHFVDPIAMYPFIVERAGRLEDNERHLDVLGLSLYTAWTTLKFWIMRPEIRDWTVRLTALLDVERCMTRWVPQQWYQEAEIFLTDVVETSQLPDVVARNVRLQAYAYDFVACVHGYRLGNGDLFISFLRWQEDGRLGKRGYTYEFIPGTEHSISAMAFRDLFDSWFQRATARGRFFPAVQPR